MRLRSHVQSRNSCYWRPLFSFYKEKTQARIPAGEIDLFRGASGHVFMDLFFEFSSFENLHRAYLNARKQKRYRKDILEYGFFLEKNLVFLRKELLLGSYRHGAYKSFIVTDSKKRKIEVAPFRDRVVHHAVCSIIEPIFERSFIYDSYACRKGKGNHIAVRRARSFMQSSTNSYRGKAYFIQSDIKKYFDSVRHDILLSLIEKKVKDKKLFWVIEEIVGSKRGNLGIPIGNLTSQLFANIYLNELDHFIKDKLGVRQYIRYMDDFFIFSKNPKILLEWRKKIKEFLSFNLGLLLHKKRNGVQSIARMDFLGYVISRHFTKLRKSTVSRIFRDFKKRELSPASLSALNGYMKHTKSYMLMRKFEFRVVQ